MLGCLIEINGCLDGNRQRNTLSGPNWQREDRPESTDQTSGQVSKKAAEVRRVRRLTLIGTVQLVDTGRGRRAETLTGSQCEW